MGKWKSVIYITLFILLSSAYSLEGKWIKIRDEGVMRCIDLKPLDPPTVKEVRWEIVNVDYDCLADELQELFYGYKLRLPRFMKKSTWLFKHGYNYYVPVEEIRGTQRIPRKKFVLNDFLKKGNIIKLDFKNIAHKTRIHFGWMSEEWEAVFSNEVSFNDTLGNFTTWNFQVYANITDNETYWKLNGTTPAWKYIVLNTTIHADAYGIHFEIPAGSTYGYNFSNGVFLSEQYNQTEAFIVGGVPLKYRRKIIINSTEDVEKIIRIDLNAENFNFSHSTGNDFRFTDEEGNLLPYYVEVYDDIAKYARLYFKANLTSGENIFYMYYGNKNAEDESDDGIFENTSINIDYSQQYDFSTASEYGFSEVCDEEYCYILGMTYDEGDGDSSGISILLLKIWKENGTVIKTMRIEDTTHYDDYENSWSLYLYNNSLYLSGNLDLGNGEYAKVIKVDKDLTNWETVFKTTYSSNIPMYIYNDNIYIGLPQYNDGSTTIYKLDMDGNVILSKTIDFSSYCRSDATSVEGGWPRNIIVENRTMYFTSTIRCKGDYNNDGNADYDDTNILVKVNAENFDIIKEQKIDLLKADGGYKYQMENMFGIDIDKNYIYLTGYYYNNTHYNGAVLKVNKSSLEIINNITLISPMKSMPISKITKRGNIYIFGSKKESDGSYYKYMGILNKDLEVLSEKTTDSYDHGSSFDYGNLYEENGKIFLVGKHYNLDYNAVIDYYKLTYYNFPEIQLGEEIEGGINNQTFVLTWATGWKYCLQHSDCPSDMFCTLTGNIYSQCVPDYQAVARIEMLSQYSVGNITLVGAYTYDNESVPYANAWFEVYNKTGSLIANLTATYDESTEKYYATIDLPEGEQYEIVFHAVKQPQYAPSTDSKKIDVILFNLFVEFPQPDDKLHSKKIYPRIRVLMSDFYKTAQCRYITNMRKLDWFIVTNNITFDEVPIDLINGRNDLRVECTVGDQSVEKQVIFETSAVPDTYLLGINLNAHLITQVMLFKTKQMLWKFGEAFTIFIFSIGLIILVGEVFILAMNKISGGSER